MADAELANATASPGRCPLRVVAVYAAAAVILASGLATPVSAQHSPVYRALDLEDAGSWEEAAAVYRAELRGPEGLQALFGLERALLTLNRGEELVVVLGELVRERPRDETVRSMYVRTLLRLERSAAARTFVQQWTTEQPLEPEAYRQLYAIAPLTAAEARAAWRRLRGRTGSDSADLIATELVAHVFANGLWVVAREILEERYSRDGSPEVAEALALAAARAGDVERARAIAAAGSLTDGAAARGWIALYDGDLLGARRLLARADDADAAAILPLSLLSRTRVSSSPEFGAGLLLLVRGDSAGAARAFARAAPQLHGAEPLLLAWAARLYAARGDAQAADALYDAVAREHPGSPEAPEAVLAQARSRLRSGERAHAVERLEHLIVTYPASALVPVARRELDVLRGAVPST
jgi:predicted Zn-dependent protease